MPPQTSQSYFMPQLPQYSVKTPTMPTYNSPYSSNNAFSAIMNNVGGYLKPMEALTQKQPFEQFAAPLREAGRQFVETTLRPQFNQNVFNPFVSHQLNQAALGNSQSLGGAYKQRQQAQNQLMQDQYYPQESQVRNTFEDMARQFYNQQLGEMYTSPIAFTNLASQLYGA